ncbi:glucosyl-3-phosphoglycerate synthase [Thermobispora bispora]|uniref:glucosyl-3-phosphoglycerate synthase n=1 Tax=Thermobispora bispora TaxID=2006 RepID=UPI00197F4D9B|nr:glucosyl-3-phosphoglycerate synthase [Thermobispora bispora]MBO2475017.1 glucosyl-3-phosphoglycerate synthase [Actinomycetales bacterium]MBX6167734.1 glucosyl-3-phosphoglycerate synthase [Thermobispora bispora]MDI9580946.1 glucosyl-3-phosphoglycerate synthase [Thermobispora sp.]QSI48369.1 glucosyl-3-phosphoglycerate synthase [Thermobispora bispora]
MLPEVEAWLALRTSSAADWPVSTLMAAKGNTTISVVLPARNEAETVGEIVSAIRRDLMEAVPLVDELVVIDSRSTDDTALRATEAGATVIAQDDILPELGGPEYDGKGEALWKALAVTTGELVVFIDADLREFRSSFVSGLVGPLLADSSVAYVKGCYDRPLIGSPEHAATGGGRVTELVARPLLNMHWPELAGFVQPLAGEYAGRRWALERVPFVTGYGVELGLLIDLLDLVGLDALAQVDLGSRVHSHQSAKALGSMAGQILHTAWLRLERQDRIIPVQPPSPLLTQFERGPSGHLPVVRNIGVAERPPMVTIPQYASRSFNPPRSAL